MPEATTTTTPAPSGYVVDLPVAAIAPECNDRTTFGDSALAELAASIAEHGLAQPITVRPRPDGSGYWLVAGERRWRAHQLIGATTIRAIVEEATDERAAAVMLLENVNRVDLDVIDEARAYRSRMERFGYSVDELAAQTGKTANVIRGRLDLLDLDDMVHDMIRTAGMWPSSARRLVGLDPDRQRIACRVHMTTDNLTREGWEALVQRLRNEQAAEAQAGFGFTIEEYVAEVVKPAKRPGGRKLVELLALAVEHVPADDPDRDAMLAAVAAWRDHDNRGGHRG